MSCAIMLQIAVHGWPWLLFQASNHHRSLKWTALSAAAQTAGSSTEQRCMELEVRGRHHKKPVSVVSFVLGIAFMVLVATVATRVHCMGSTPDAIGRQNHASVPDEIARHATRRTTSGRGCNHGICTPVIIDHSVDWRFCHQSGLTAIDRVLDCIKHQLSRIHHD